MKLLDFPPLMFFCWFLLIKPGKIDFFLFILCCMFTFLCFSVLFFPSFSGILSLIYFTNPSPSMVFHIDASFFFLSPFVHTKNVCSESTRMAPQDASALFVSSHVFFFSSLPPLNCHMLFKIPFFLKLFFGGDL